MPVRIPYHAQPQRTQIHASLAQSVVRLVDGYLFLKGERDSHMVWSGALRVNRCAQ